MTTATKTADRLIAITPERFALGSLPVGGAFETRAVQTRDFGEMNTAILTP